MRNLLKVCDLRCEYKKNPIGIDILIPRLGWKIEADKRNTLQSAYEIQVTQENSSFLSIFWNSGKVKSDRSMQVDYKGEDLSSCTRYYFRVRVWNQDGDVSDWSDTSFWEMGLLKKQEWIAEWITPDFKIENCENDPCPMLRKEFSSTKFIKRARAYVTSLGLYELYINGNRISDELFTPGWTSYNKRLQYQTFDITGEIQQGKNAIGIILGNGWYKGYLGWNGKKELYGDKLAALIQLHILYEDGSEEIVKSDQSFKATSGPILMSQLYHGETYDARLEKKGWNQALYNEVGWSSVSELKIKKNLIAQENVPVKRIEEIKPLEVIITPKGETVIDMGQNMIGWIKLKVKGEAGSKVVYEHAEVLDKYGNFYNENLRSAKQIISYTLKGNETEVYEPHFTFQGFRYIKLVEYPGEVCLANFTGIVVHSDMEVTGKFECSNELINKLQHNILWGQKGNFLDVPTDCPQRDERLGWTGDAQVFVRTASFNMNTASFFTKWLRDLKADQFTDGGVPWVIPNVLHEMQNSSAAWGDAAVICPWTIYQCFDDKRILEEQYESMKAWVEYIRKEGKNEYLWNTGFHFGDWLGLDSMDGTKNGATCKDFIATAFFAYSTSLMLKTAKILDKKEDIIEYQSLKESITQAFRKEFVTASGRLAVPTQTAHVLALMFNLMEEKHVKRTVDTLLQYIKENKNHLTTGFIGTPYLCHVLSQNGYTDIAYQLIMQTDYPSWLYQITKGATTIWEHWDGIKEDGSFWDKEMNSFNHYSYGAIGDWLYRVVGGINIDEEKPGYKNILINPQPGLGIESAKTEIESSYGTISCEWSKKDNSMEVNLQIPPNTYATIDLSAMVEGTLQEEYKKIEITTDRLKLGSGTYKFKYGYDYKKKERNK